jgi:hypothetical protein
MTDYEAGLEEQAQAVDTPAEVAPVKERKARAKTERTPKLYPQWNEDGSPLLDDEGVQVQGETKMKKPKAPKPAKVVVYQLDEEGNQLLDAEGNPIPVKPVRAAAVRRLPTHEASTININEEQAAKIAAYKGARSQYAVLMSDGQTIAEYLEAGGDKGFLSFYLRDGACSVTAYTPPA